MPRVVINATHLGERLDGIGVYVLQLLGAWARMPTNLRFEVWLHEAARPHLQDLAFPDRFELRWVTTRAFHDRDLARRFLFSSLLAARRRRDVIFNPSQLQITFAGARQVVTVLDVTPLRVGHPSLRNQRLFYRHILPRGVARAAAVITPSESSRRALEEEMGIPSGRIHVIPLGVRALDSGGADPPPRERYVLFAGRLASHRNLDRLVAAFVQIADRVPHDLVIVGEPANGWRPPSHPRIAFTGYVSDRELARWYRGASVFVFPSLTEGFGLPAVEAMAAGCPVVVSRGTGAAEACGPAAAPVDPESVASIAEGILAVLCDEELRSRLVRAGLKRAAELTWERSARAHLRLLEDVAEGATG